MGRHADPTDRLWNGCPSERHIEQGTDQVHTGASGVGGLHEAWVDVDEEGAIRTQNDVS